MKFQFKSKISVLIICMVVFVLVVVFAIGFSKYRFGYFAKGPIMKYNHYWADVLKLKDGNILILGSNKKINSINQPAKINEIPSEIYNFKENKFSDVKFPNSIKYLSRGILLPDNKLLLTFVCNSKDNPLKIKNTPKHIYIDKDDFYNSMAIIDLDTYKIEKIIKKKINDLYKPNEISTKFLYLNNKVFIFDFANSVIEIYDINKNFSELVENVNLKIKSAHVNIMEKDRNNILIFGVSDNNEKNSNIYEYNIPTKKIKMIFSNLINNGSAIEKISEDKIAIIGGSEFINNKSHISKTITIYNIQKNKIESIGKMQENRGNGLCNLSSCFSANKISKNLILLAGGRKEIFFNVSKYIKTAEIYDIYKKKSYKIINMPFEFDKNNGVQLNNGDYLFVENGNKNRSLIFKNFK